MHSTLCAVHPFPEIRLLKPFDMAKLHLQPNVFACEANGHLVFLDLGRDAYTALDRNQSRLISSAISALHEGALNDAHRATANMDEMDKLARTMIDAGLLTAKGRQGNAPAPPTIAVPTRSFAIEPTEQCIEPHIIEVLRFFYACLRASRAFRSLSILEIAESIRTRRRREIARTAPFEMTAVERLVRIFQHRRPFYARPYLCLYDSLALLEFLAMYGIYPSWVYGVTAEPFYAHCWVQEGDLVLNEAVEVALSYTPIMVV